MTEDNALTIIKSIKHVYRENNWSHGKTQVWLDYLEYEDYNIVKNFVWQWMRFNDNPPELVDLFQLSL